MLGDISMGLILHSVLFLVISLCLSLAEQMCYLEVSKACYGTEQQCTFHKLRCRSGQIAIKEAFYRSGTACGIGVSNCDNVNVNSIPLTGKKYNFSETEMNWLYGNCSTHYTCSLRAYRRMTITFSAIVYECINASDNINITCNETTTTGATASNGNPTTGIVVGIIIPICIIIAGVVTAVLIFRRRRMQRKGENGNVAEPKSNPQVVQSLEKRSSPDYDYATITNYVDLVPHARNMPAPLKGSSDYDCATFGDQKVNRDHPVSRNTQTRDIDYDHIGHQPARANCHYDTTLSVAGTMKGGNSKHEVYSYNHLNEEVSSNANVDSTYNTTASTRQKLDASSNNMEDDYDYNHLGTESKKNLPQNEYDTTASAIQDVSRMNGDMEDSTYNHAHLVTSSCSSSGMTNAGFHHASPLKTFNKDEYKFNASPNGNPQEDGGTDVYKLALEAESNPYQLAK